MSSSHNQFFLTLHKDKSQWESALYSVKRDVDLLLPAVQKAGYTLQSIRVITNPFGEYLDLTNFADSKSRFTVFNGVIK